MADEREDLEDDQWLYGDTSENNAENQENEASEDIEKPQENEQPPDDGPPGEPQFQPVVDDGPPGVENEDIVKENDQQDNQESMEDGEVRQNGDDSEKEDLDDDSDDDVNVVIGDIKTTAPSYTSLNIKRGGVLQTTDRTKQPQQQTGKFTIEEFEQIGTINGVPSTEFNLDSLEDKPWRKPGADITDYFNYGFNEDTWRAYCERQKRIRVNESGVGLIPMNPTGLPQRGPVPITNDNSKYAGVGGGVVAASPGYAAMQRGVMVAGKPDQPKVNTIQVMTADRREYSRKQSNFPDMTVPPPFSEPFQPDYSFNPEPEPFYGYEPTQDVQWGGQPPPNWAPSDLKTLTGPPPNTPMGPPSGPHHPPRSPRREREESPVRDSREGRSESRARSERRDRERERSHRRERSRSRGRSRRKSKSRSRSPGHRSHRKKKSRRHEDSD